jgi:phosphomevalonate kinase
LIAAGGPRIEALAPGKVVLWGEYAVLAGAPALVLAVDRYARCTISVPPRSIDGTDSAPREWRFASAGFVTAPVALAHAELCANVPPAADSPARTTWQVLQALDRTALPEAADVLIDTAGFYRAGTKLGLGSSAAACVALYGAMCELIGATGSFTAIADIHRRIQGGRGSGIDVAAAWFGGLLRFRRDVDSATRHDPEIATAVLPEHLSLGFVWAGHPAVTSTHLERFAAWRERGATVELDALCAASGALFEAGDTLERLRFYVRCLEALDRAADLAIYDAGHRELHRLAAGCGVVYKPCGAGGGDIGAAFSYDPRALERFLTTARERGYAPITLETAAHGIDVRR